MNYLVPLQLGAPDYKLKSFYVYAYVPSIKSIVNSFIYFQFFIFNQINFVSFLALRGCHIFLMYLSLITINVKEKKMKSLQRDGVGKSKCCASKAEPLNITSLGPYLAGLWEGDGHISNLNRKEGANCYPYLAITFPLKDEELVSYLQRFLGGRIRRKDKENALVLIIGSSLKELINIVQVMNGYLRTPKLFEFNKLIELLNDRFNLNIQLHSEDQSSLESNGWLAGFFDADGSFKVRYTEQIIEFNKVKRKGRIEVRIAIEQRKYHPKTKSPFEPIMRSISDFFTVKLNTSYHNINKSYWVIEVTSLSKLKKFFLYLNKFPLMTSKKNDFKDWHTVYNMVFLNEHLTDEGKFKIKNIKNKMNKKRTSFDWSHLK
jgi:hypothetical protein